VRGLVWFWTRDENWHARFFFVAEYLGWSMMKCGLTFFFFTKAGCPPTLGGHGGTTQLRWGRSKLLRYEVPNLRLWTMPNWTWLRLAVPMFRSKSQLGLCLHKRSSRECFTESMAESMGWSSERVRILFYNRIHDWNIVELIILYNIIVSSVYVHMLSWSHSFITKHSIHFHSFASHSSCSILAGFEVSKNTHFKVTVITELDDGKIYRKPLYLMVKTMVSCRFSQQN
jgi:hypothetical protein